MKVWSRMFAVNVQSVSVHHVNWNFIIWFTQTSNVSPVVYVIKVLNTLRLLRLLRIITDSCCCLRNLRNSPKIRTYSSSRSSQVIDLDGSINPVKMLFWTSDVGNGIWGMKSSRDPERSRSWPRYIWMQISWKRLKIETRYQWVTNRKGHVANRLVTWPMTSRDLKRSSRDFNMFVAHYLVNGWR